VKRIYLKLDPEERRVAASPREPHDGDRPPGLRGAGWPRRQLDVESAVWEKMMTAQYTPDEQDEIHRDWWNRADPEGPPWPYLKGEA
jgi:hypothetical protein